MQKGQVGANVLARHTPEEVNSRILMQMEKSVLYYSHHPELIGRRLCELEAEWDIERSLKAVASSLALFSLLLSFVHRRKVMLAVVMNAFLLMHAIHGWCPPALLMRQFHVRTKDEILRERYALRALRGDFDKLPTNTSGEPAERARTILDAMSEKYEVD